MKVSVGVYDSVYEAERAAEAFCPPKWHEPNKDSRCVESKNVYARTHTSSSALVPRDCFLTARLCVLVATFMVFASLGEGRH